MDHATQVALIEELHGLRAAGQFFVAEGVTAMPITAYGADRFAQEEAMFARVPHPVALSGDLPGSGDFITRDLFGTPLLITRGADGQARVMINVCRHRGARLVADAAGCAARFTCPYHAWTYSNSGDLRAAPHAESGFPGLDKSAHSLTQLPVYEDAGLIWTALDGQAPLADFADPLQSDLIWAGFAGLTTVKSEVIEVAANWKLLVEGGLEAYHFKVAHKDTIGAHFLENLSSFTLLGPHLRSILPRTSLPDLAETPQDTWSLRDHANVLYTLTPTSQFLLMQDHVAWIEATPLTHARTRLRIATLAPKGVATPEHWARNHAITRVTLDEDFALNESTQAGLASGAQTHLTFGQYEGALAAFHTQIAQYL